MPNMPKDQFHLTASFGWHSGKVLIRHGDMVGFVFFWEAAAYEELMLERENILTIS